MLANLRPEPQALFPVPQSWPPNKRLDAVSGGRGVVLLPQMQDRRILHPNWIARLRVLGAEFAVAELLDSKVTTAGDAASLTVHPVENRAIQTYLDSFQATEMECEWPTSRPDLTRRSLVGKTT